MTQKKRKAAMHEHVSVSKATQPAIEIKDPGPSPCCFTVCGTAAPGTYVHVSISEVGGVAVIDPHPGFATAGDDGNWCVSVCVPVAAAAGTIIRVRACIYDPITGTDGVCTDIPVRLTADCLGVINE
jgi:hypothetical protein